MRPLWGFWVALALGAPGAAGAHTGFHHSTGGSGSSGGSGRLSIDPDDDCIRWERTDAGQPDAGDGGGLPDAGGGSLALHLGEQCVEHAKLFGCSTGGLAAPTAAVAVLLFLALRRRAAPSRARPARRGSR